ncbi:DNA replication protein DnaC [Paenibacillus harenae]|nr:DNA replication protein DnaC [Paenibacillus harenae]
MKQSKITEEFKSKLFKNFMQEGMSDQVYNAWKSAGTYAKKFAEIRSNRQNGMALLGIPGSGKTHLCMAVCNHLIRNGEGLIYFPWVEGFNELKANLNELEERVGLLQRIPILYIDDMWKGRKEPTDFQIEQTFAIINYRYMNNLPIIISSEFDIDAMCAFDMAIGSRIYEMCRDFCVVIEGGRELNYRLREEA